MIFILHISCWKRGGKFTRRAMERFVTLIEIGMHLIMCISGNI